MKKMYITMQQDPDSATGSGWTVKAYPTEEAALAACERSNAVRERYRKALREKENELGKDWKAIKAWNDSPEAKTLLEGYTREQYYEEVELVE